MLSFVTVPLQSDRVTNTPFYFSWLQWCCSHWLGFCLQPTHTSLLTQSLSPHWHSHCKHQQSRAYRELRLMYMYTRTQPHSVWDATFLLALTFFLRFMLVREVVSMSRGSTSRSSGSITLGPSSSPSSSGVMIFCCEARLRDAMISRSLPLGVGVTGLQSYSVWMQ